MSDKSVSDKCLEYLQKNGPSAVSEVPNGGTPLRRLEKLDDFKISLGGYGGSESTRVQSMRFGYIVGEHAADEVIEEWILVHQEALENFSHRAIYYGTPEWLRDAIRSYLKDDVFDSGGESDIGGVCDICGEEYETNYPYHLRNDCD